jgi:hypothetical protein
MAISLEDLKKLEFSGKTLRKAFAPTDRLEAIMKVKVADYVPPRVTVRARIDPRMFTGAFLAADLPALEADPNVEVVSLAHPLPSIGDRPPQ